MIGKLGSKLFWLHWDKPSHTAPKQSPHFYKKWQFNSVWIAIFSTVKLVGLSSEIVEEALQEILNGLPQIEK